MSYVEPSLSRTADLAGQTAPPSLALTTRLTGFFFLASLLLVAICSGILYAAVIAALRQADNQVVEKRMTAVLELLETKELNEGLVAHEVDEDNQGPRQIFIRVVTDFNPLALETPSMTERLPTSLFPDVTKAPLNVPQYKTLVTANGATYEALAIRVPVTAKPGPDEVVIQVATDTTLDKESMVLFRRVLFYMLNAAVPLCALVAWWLVRRELAPLSRISKAAATIDGESLDTRLALNGLPTELHTLALQFNHMLARLEATCDGLKQYADNIAHELRTPINRMRLESELALRQSMTKEEYAEVISSNVSECESLTRLLQGLLFIARAESHQATISPRPFDVEKMLETVRCYFDAGAEASGVQLNINADRDLQLSADRDLVQRSIANVLSNALSHTSKGGTVTVSATRRPSGIEFIIADNGEGIAPEHHARVFDRFYRAGNTKVGHSERLGLGLAITKSIVDLHGGTIAVESARGAGTKFTMTFPDHRETPGLTFRSLDHETYPRRDLSDDEAGAKAAQ